MGANEPLAKRVWKSKAFIITFAIFAFLGVYGAITSLLEHYNLFKLVLEFIVSLIIALILGLIAYGIASLISRGKKRE
jgi:cation transporter-like permease